MKPSLIKEWNIPDVTCPLGPIHNYKSSDFDSQEVYKNLKSYYPSAYELRARHGAFTVFCAYHCHLKRFRTADYNGERWIYATFYEHPMGKAPGWYSQKNDNTRWIEGVN